MQRRLGTHTRGCFGGALLFLPAVSLPKKESYEGQHLVCSHLKLTKYVPQRDLRIPRTKWPDTLAITFQSSCESRNIHNRRKQ